MPFQSGTVSIAATASKICTVPVQGCLVQNLGSVVVTLGGSGVTAGSGVALPASMTSPVFVPGANASVSGTVPAGATTTEDLYGIGASAGPTSVVYTVPG